MKKSIISAIALLLSVFFLIISISVAVPILTRNIYYTQLYTTDLERLGNHSKEELKEAYDDILDYITLKEKDFSCGQLRFSESGADHFKDCRTLFIIDLLVFIISATSSIILLLLRKRCNIYLGKLPAAFYSGILGIILITTVGIFAIDGFNGIFIVFHKIFFAGKTNWYFDPSCDEIINYLPESFFLNCAVVIGACILTLSVITIILTASFKRRK